MRRGAFTLVELLVALAIGGVICGTAFAAVRAAGHAFTVGTRLSVENQLMRNGVYAALDELDTWKYYDNAPSSTPLRNDGDPFAPLGSSSSPAPFGDEFNFEFLPVREPTASGDSYEAWWRRDLRTWWSGDPTSEDFWEGDKHLGDCSLFGWEDYTDGTVLGGADKRWYHRMVRDVTAHLGYYALLDMAPPSLVATYYQGPTFQGMGCVPGDFMASNPGGPGPIGTSWWDDRPHDFVALTLGGFYTIGIPSKATNPVHNIPNLSHSMWLTYTPGWGGPVTTGWTADDAFNSVGGRLDVMPLKPAHWPDLHVTVRHYIANSRNFHAAYVLLQSPQTGQDFKLRFSFTGTTLRGARRQRPGLEPDYANGSVR